MRYIRMITVAVLCAVAAGQAFSDRIGDFALIDQEGRFHQLSRYGHQKAVILIAQANGCELFPSTLPRLNKLRQEWQNHPVTFLMINASGIDSRTTIQQEAAVYDIDYPILHDQTQLVAETLGISAVGEILVIDPSTQKLVFQGPLDARKHRSSDPDEPTPLADAIARTVAGRSGEQSTLKVALPDNNETAPCTYRFEQQALHAAVPPDYALDIAPIIQSNCVNCHRQGGIGPFAMDSYQMVRGFSLMMREVLLTKRMPPSQVDPEVGHFTNAPYLSDADLRTLIHWIDADAPRGTGTDPLLVKRSQEAESDWPLGKPDYIVNVPTQQIPATGVIDYINVMIELPFDEDKWIRAVHFKPGDTKVMHHLLSYGQGHHPSLRAPLPRGLCPGKK